MATLSSTTRSSHTPSSLIIQDDDEPYITAWSKASVVTVQPLSITSTKINHVGKKILIETKIPSQTILIRNDMALEEFESTFWSGVDEGPDPMSLPHHWRFFVEHEGYLISRNCPSYSREYVDVVIQKNSKVYLIHRLACAAQIKAPIRAQAVLLDPLYLTKTNHLDFRCEYGYLKWKQIIPTIKYLFSASQDDLRAFVREFSRSHISLQFSFFDIKRIRVNESLCYQPAQDGPRSCLSNMPEKVHEIICSYLNYFQSFDFQENYSSITTRSYIFERELANKDFLTLFHQAIEAKRLEAAEARVIRYFDTTYSQVFPHIYKMHMARELDKNWEALFVLLLEFKSAVQEILADKNFDPKAFAKQELALVKGKDWKKECERLCPSIVDESKILFEVLDEIIKSLNVNITFKVKYRKLNEITHFNLRSSTPHLSNLYLPSEADEDSLIHFETHLDSLSGTTFEKNFTVLSGISWRKIHQLIGEWLDEVGTIKSYFKLLDKKGTTHLPSGRAFHKFDHVKELHVIATQTASWKEETIPDLALEEELFFPEE